MLSNQEIEKLKISTSRHLRGLIQDAEPYLKYMNDNHPGQWQEHVRYYEILVSVAKAVLASRGEL